MIIMKAIRIAILLFLISCSSVSRSELVDSNILSNTLKGIGITNTINSQRILIITPNKSCSSCNEELVNYFRNHFISDNLLMVLISPSSKEVRNFLLDFNIDADSERIYIDKKLTMNLIKEASFPAVVIKEEDELSFYSITPENVSDFVK